MGQVPQVPERADARGRDAAEEVRCRGREDGRHGTGAIGEGGRQLTHSRTRVSESVRVCACVCGNREVGGRCTGGPNVSE
jgi:hypothetical protein